MIQNTQSQGKRIDEDTWKNLIYLSACAVNGRTPDTQEIGGCSVETLYSAAREHMLSAAVGMALETAGIQRAEFTQAVAAAQRKNALLDADRMKVLASLEKAGIWYMPLKGAVLKDFYPRYGMREMADNDILFDPARRADVRGIMQKLGFQTKVYGVSNEDVYYKKPVSNFEMHESLFYEDRKDPLWQYYQGIKKRLVKDETNEYGYHFSEEDFYLFMIAHEYKHYMLCGTGIRSLLDTYVFLKNKQPDLNWDYIRQETEKMGLAAFEPVNRSLAFHLFDRETLSGEEEKMLEYILSSGAHGTLKNLVMKGINEKGQRGFFFSRLSLSKEDMLNQYPVLRKAPFLYPVMWIWRLIRRFFGNHAKFMYELRAALGIKKSTE